MSSFIELCLRGERLPEEIADASSPAVAGGEEAMISRHGRLAVAAMIAGVDGETVRRQRLRKTSVSRRMFGQAVRDLKYGAWRVVRQPAIDVNLRAVVRRQAKAVGAHVRTP